MATEITTTDKRSEMLNSMRPSKEQLESVAYQKHRQAVAFELEIISTKIDRFGWGQMASAMKDRLTLDWCDVLSPFRMAEVRTACAELMDARPRDATNEQQVRAIILKHRAKTLAAIPKQKEPEPATERTPEEKARVAAVIDEYLDKRKMHKPAPIWKQIR